MRFSRPIYWMILTKLTIQKNKQATTTQVNTNDEKLQNKQTIPVLLPRMTFYKNK